MPVTRLPTVSDIQGWPNPFQKVNVYFSKGKRLYSFQMPALIKAQLDRLSLQGSLPLNGLQAGTSTAVVPGHLADGLTYHEATVADVKLPADAVSKPSWDAPPRLTDTPYDAPGHRAETGAAAESSVAELVRVKVVSLQLFDTCKNHILH